MALTDYQKFTQFDINSNKSYEFTPSYIYSTGYWVGEVCGFLQGVGGIDLILRLQNNNLSIKDLWNGTSFSNSNLEIIFDNGKLKFSSPQTSISRLKIKNIG